MTISGSFGTLEGHFKQVANRNVQKPHGTWIFAKDWRF